MQVNNQVVKPNLVMENQRGSFTVNNIISLVKKLLSRQKNLSSCSCEYSRRLMARKWTFWIFQGTVATFYRWGRQICNFLVWIFLRIPCTKIIKICLFSYSNNNRV